MNTSMRTSRSTVLLLALASALSVSASASAAILYVDGSAPSAGDGATWDTAFQFLQDALRQASSGDQVRVADGTYLPDLEANSPNGSGSRSASFFLQTGVTISGGFAGLGAPDPNSRDVALFVTILSGDIGVAGDPNDNSYHVVSAVETGVSATLDGCTVAYGFSGGDATLDGAGAYLAGDATFRDCIIRDNVTGPGIGFPSSLSGGNGAGAFCAGGVNYFIGCTIRNNTTGAGAAGICDDGVIPEAATSGGDGGGLYSAGAAPILINCQILDNRTGNGGPGASCGNNGCTNGASGGTGAGAHLTSGGAVFINCVIAGNITGSGGNAGTAIEGSCSGGSGGSGGAIYASGGANVFANCTIVANGTGLGGDGIPPGSEGLGGGLRLSESTAVVTNCILWANLRGATIDEASQISGSSAAVQNSCVQGWSGTLGGTGNTGSDPLFVSLAGRDFRLQVASPLIDAGSNTLVVPDVQDLDADGDPNEPTPFDITRHPRIVDGNRDGSAVVDMGAYEFFFDCNLNDIDDAADIASGTSFDCNLNGIPDECDITNGTSLDCNQNGIPDNCDISSGTSHDCDQNGVPDECQPDSDHDGVIDACDACPTDPMKTALGACGCGVPDTDTDGDGTPDCHDGCPTDPRKTAPGACGCGNLETDTDDDGAPDCVDNCPLDYNPDQADANENGIGDVCENSCFMLCLTRLIAGESLTTGDVADCHCLDQLDDLLAVAGDRIVNPPSSGGPSTSDPNDPNSTTGGPSQADADALLAALCPASSALLLSLTLVGLVRSRRLR